MGFMESQFMQAIKRAKRSRGMSSASEIGDGNAYDEEDEEQDAKLFRLWQE